MHKQSAIIDFTGYAEDVIVGVSRLIQNEMTTNVLVYPTPPFAAATALKGLIDTYELVFDKPIYDTRTADLHAARVALNGALHDNGVYVNTIAKGNMTKLVQSGFP